MGSIDVDGVPVAFAERGAGTPIVLVHGWQGDRTYLQADLEDAFDRGGASDGWRRIYLDLPGHGATPAPPRIARHADVADLLVAFSRRLLGTAPFAVVGSSWGGWLALEAARALPDRILGLALVVPWLPDADGRSDAPPSTVLVEDPTAFADLAPDEAWIPERLVEQRRSAVELIRRDELPAIRAADRDLLARLDAGGVDAAAVRPGLPPLHRPALVLTGRQDDTVGYEAAWGLRDELPRATFACLDLAGHWLGRVERPAAFRALVADWLERLRIDGA